jgi:hypothetical protein
MSKVLKNISKSKNAKAEISANKNENLSNAISNPTSLTAKIFNFRRNREERDLEARKKETRVYEDTH